MTAARINVITATQTEKYRIRLCFDDRTEQEVDFEPFLSQSLHPDIRAYLDFSVRALPTTVVAAISTC